MLAATFESGLLAGAAAAAGFEGAAFAGAAGFSAAGCSFAGAASFDLQPAKPSASAIAATPAASVFVSRITIYSSLPQGSSFVVSAARPRRPGGSVSHCGSDGKPIGRAPVRPRREGTGPINHSQVIRRNAVLEPRIGLIRSSAPSRKIQAP